MASLAAALTPHLIAQNGRGHTKSGSSHITPARARSVGTRAEVMQGTAHHTGGGLTKADLKYNKQGTRIVSRRASAAAKKANKLAPFSNKTFVKGRPRKQKGSGVFTDIGTGLMAGGLGAEGTVAGAPLGVVMQGLGGGMMLGDAIYDHFK